MRVYELIAIKGALEVTKNTSDVYDLLHHEVCSVCVFDHRIVKIQGFACLNACLTSIFCVCTLRIGTYHPRAIRQSGIGSTLRKLEKDGFYNYNFGSGQPGGILNPPYLIKERATTIIDQYSTAIDEFNNCESRKHKHK